ncbi:MAG: hypothetical protein ACI89L_001464 [Phycisphaerales bacterium]|jgi:hypothetical protein
MTESLRALMTGLIDYSGIFPPSKQPMDKATSNYARYLMEPNVFALGRFICATSRLEELTTTGAMVMPGTYATSGYQEMIDAADPWSVSAVIDGDLEACLDKIDLFNEHHSHADHGRARVDAIEMRVSTPSEIDDAIDIIPDDLSVAFEFPLQVVNDGDARGYIAALAGNAATAKIRCGGLTPDVIPETAKVAEFIVACAQAGVPFKATAGLHHPVRAHRPLTYEEGCPTGTMHGFMNVFLGACLHHAKAIDAAQLLECLNETDAKAFTFTDAGAAWRGHEIETGKVIRARETFCVSYGSCSFEEPFDDLKELGLL